MGRRYKTEELKEIMDKRKTAADKENRKVTAVSLQQVRDRIDVHIYVNITEMVLTLAADETYNGALNELVTDVDNKHTVEYHLVSNWLGEKLSEHGEIVVHGFMGTTIWRRYRIDQPIFHDDVMMKITEQAMGIKK